MYDSPMALHCRLSWQSLTRKQRLLSIPLQQQLLRQSLRHPHHLLKIAVSRSVGCLACEPSPKQAYVALLACLPQCHAARVLGHGQQGQHTPTPDR